MIPVFPPVQYRFISRTNRFLVYLLIAVLCKISVSIHFHRGRSFIAITHLKPLKNTIKLQNASPEPAMAEMDPITEPENEKMSETIKGIKKQKEMTISTESAEDREKETTAWRVMLYNDDIHSFTYVTECLARCVPQLTLAKAHTITVHAHKTGQATILHTWRDKANAYCQELQKCGLTVCAIYDSTKRGKS
ncbi:bifunctional ATP-dependent Clp protease adaptor protein ClpS/Adaptor protein ClpS [Babesia duncani]|uniref:Bifunctional ATP-dependent Clp protease adaptor protein ClpS/Adaptor protein ClpS n=1 Tax=Babesia duncani TaxID=323732 RepID=A0AAD9PP98_9APIC|nr:bifunctional ATP-dependent Clp protease adaptor protein ClpS/Adaptor protein ClpS [Babesia duncani]